MKASIQKKNCSNLTPTHTPRTDLDSTLVIVINHSKKYPKMFCLSWWPLLPFGRCSRAARKHWSGYRCLVPARPFLGPGSAWTSFSLLCLCVGLQPTTSYFLPTPASTSCSLAYEPPCLSLLLRLCRMEMQQQPPKQTHMMSMPQMMIIRLTRISTVMSSPVLMALHCFATCRLQKKTLNRCAQTT